MQTRRRGVLAALPFMVVLFLIMVVAAPAAMAQVKNAWGVTLPGGRGAAEPAVPSGARYRRHHDGFRHDVYKRPANIDMLSTPMVQINKNFEVIFPARRAQLLGVRGRQDLDLQNGPQVDVERRQPGDGG